MEEVIALLLLLKGVNMRYLLLLLSFQVSAELDLTIPKQPAVYVPDVKILQPLKWREAPTKIQTITFWTLNVLDVYTTRKGLKKTYTTERNPLLGSKPSIAQLILLKSIMGPIIILGFDKKEMSYVNPFLLMVVHSNYQYIK